MENFLESLWRLAAIAVVMAVTCGVIKLLLSRRKASANWRKAGLAASQEPAAGIVFGRDTRGKCVYSPANDEGHCAVFGSSGCGKTSALLIPTLRAWTSGTAGNNTCFVIDISGDISSNVHCRNKLVFEPGNGNSVPYDVFAMIDTLPDDGQKNEALAQLAFLMMPDEEDADASSRFWRRNARNMLTASLIYLYHKDFDFQETCSAIVSLSYSTLIDQICGDDNYTAMQYIKQYVGAKPENLANFKASCDSAVMLFVTNKNVAMSIRRPREGEAAFTPAALERYNVFVVIPDDKLKLYAPLLQIITAQCLEYFSSRPVENRGKILFALDEFASIKVDITDALRKLRKKNIRIMICTQSLADINQTLGRDAHKTLLSNFKHKVLMDVAEADSQEYFARLIGKEQKTKHSQTSRGNYTVSDTWSSEKDYIIEPTELARLGDDLILLHPMGWSRLRKNYYFKKR